MWTLKTHGIPAGTQRIINKCVKMEISCPVTNKRTNVIFTAHVKDVFIIKVVRLIWRYVNSRGNLPFIVNNISLKIRSQTHVMLLIMATEKSDPLGKRKCFLGLPPNFSSWLTRQYYWILIRLTSNPMVEGKWFMDQSQPAASLEWSIWEQL